MQQLQRIQIANFHPARTPNRLSGSIHVEDFIFRFNETQSVLKTPGSEESRSDREFAFGVDETRLTRNGIKSVCLPGLDLHSRNTIGESMSSEN